MVGTAIISYGVYFSVVLVGKITWFHLGDFHPKASGKNGFGKSVVSPNLHVSVEYFTFVIGLFSTLSLFSRVVIMGSVH